MKNHQLVSISFLVYLLLSSATILQAWVVTPALPVSSPRHRGENNNRNVFSWSLSMSSLSKEPETTRTETTLPAWMQVPNKQSSTSFAITTSRSISSSNPQTKFLQSFELIIGRLAMVAATGLLAREVISGQGILQQIQNMHL